MADDKNIRETSFNADAYFMYHLQDVTKLPTSVLLGYFSDLGKKVAQIGWDFMDKDSTRGMRKEIHDFFPGTSVPFMLFVKGHRYKEYVSGTVEECYRYYASITVGFPEKATYIKQAELDNIIMEKQLLGGSEMPPFERPEPKTPKLYKDLMKEIRSKVVVADEN